MFNPFHFTAYRSTYGYSDLGIPITRNYEGNLYTVKLYVWKVGFEFTFVLWNSITEVPYYET